MATAAHLTLDLSAYVNLFIMVDPNKLICCYSSESLGSSIHVCSLHWMTTDWKIYPIIEAILFIIQLTYLHLFYFCQDELIIIRDLGYLSCYLCSPHDFVLLC